MLTLRLGIRKLKCSGEPSGCSRCIAENVVCHYSQRKTMGRPRKRQREEVREAQDMNGDPGPSRDFDLTGGDNPLQGRGVSNQIPLPEDEYGSNGFQNGDYDQIGSFHNNSEIGFDPFRNDALNFELPHGPVSEPILDLSSLDPSQDFSKYFPDISKTPNNMVQLQTQYTNAEADTAGVQPVGTNTTGCACLPNLYSTLGSFHRMPPPSFPYSIGALKKAVNLGREVVRCQNCTQTYNTAIQNSTMLSALVQMIGESYFRNHLTLLGTTYGSQDMSREQATSKTGLRTHCSLKEEC